MSIENQNIIIKFVFWKSCLSKRFEPVIQIRRRIDSALYGSPLQWSEYPSNWVTDLFNKIFRSHSSKY